MAVAAIEAYDDAVVPSFARPFTGAILQAVSDLHPGRILDLGCGSGATARDLLVAWPAATVLGIDTRLEAVAVAASRSVQELGWAAAEAGQLPFRDASLDLVVAQQVVQFLPEYSVACREMSRVLRPGGRLVVASWSAGGNPVLATLDRILLGTGLRQTPQCGRAQSFHHDLMIAAASDSGLEVFSDTKADVTWEEPNVKRFVACFIPDATPEGRDARRAAVHALTEPMRLECDLLTVVRP